jgi:hypothetical protein
LDATFNNRSDKEVASILHFLEQKRAYKTFKFLPPEPYGSKVVYTGVDTIITGDRSLYNNIGAGDDLLFTEASGAYVDVERKVKSVELISGDLDYNFEHGITKVTLDLGLPSYYDIKADGTSSGDNSFVILKNFYCLEWNHNYVFNDNNNVNLKLIECPVVWKSPPDLHIDGEILVKKGTTVRYEAQAKDPEKIDLYRFYNANSPIGWLSTGATSISTAKQFTFNTSGLNTLRFEAKNSLGVYHSIDYDVMVGAGLSVAIKTQGGSDYIPVSGAVGLFFNSNSLSFISGTKFWWSDEDEPAYTPVKFNANKLTSYNKYYTGANSVNASTARYFNTGNGYGDFVVNFKARDMAGEELTASKTIHVLEDEEIARVYFKNSNAGQYIFNQKYYLHKQYSNKNFLNSGDLSAHAFVPNIAGEVEYTWIHKNTTYSDGSKVTVTRHAPIGTKQYSGDYYNVSAGLTSTYPASDVFAMVEMECLVSGPSQGGTTITGKNDVTFVFNWNTD